MTYGKLKFVTDGSKISLLVCNDCGCVVGNSLRHDLCCPAVPPLRPVPGGFPITPRLAAWRDEIAEAKRTMTKDEFADWLRRKMNAVG